MKKTPPLPTAIKFALKQLGENIKLARIERRLTMALVCDRAFISRPTLSKIEQGNPNVSLGHYATVLFVLGLHGQLGQLGKLKITPNLPKRVRKRKGE